MNRDTIIYFTYKPLYFKITLILIYLKIKHRKPPNKIVIIFLMVFPNFLRIIF